MAKVSCPYCYHRIDDAKLWFRCRGRGSPGIDGCRPEPDEERERHTGFLGEVLPSFGPSSWRARWATHADCPTCLGETGVRVCPVCHTPLPTTFVRSSSRLVGMVGGKGAGKTVYLTVLDHQLGSVVRRRFEADVRSVGDRPGGEPSPKQYQERRDSLVKDGKLFESTPAARDGRREPLVLEWRQPRRRSFGRTAPSSTLLSFYDSAGEDLDGLDTTYTQAYLGSADGMIVLLDPWQLPDVRGDLRVPDAAVAGADDPLTVLTRMTDLLRVSTGVGGGMIRTPVAVVFAKIDALYPAQDYPAPLSTPAFDGPGYDEETGESIHEYVRALLHRYGADDLDALLRLNFRTFRYFAVSALGTEPDYEAMEVRGGVQPFRVEDPLLWLLSRLNVIDRSRP